MNKKQSKKQSAAVIKTAVKLTTINANEHLMSASQRVAMLLQLKEGIASEFFLFVVSIFRAAGVKLTDEMLPAIHVQRVKRSDHSATRSMFALRTGQTPQAWFSEEMDYPTMCRTMLRFAFQAAARTDRRNGYADLVKTVGATGKQSNPEFGHLGKAVAVFMRGPRGAKAWPRKQTYDVPQKKGAVGSKQIAFELNGMKCRAGIDALKAIYLAIKAGRKLAITVSSEVETEINAEQMKLLNAHKRATANENGNSKKASKANETQQQQDSATAVSAV